MGVTTEGRSNPFQVDLFTDDLAAVETIRAALGHSGHNWGDTPGARDTLGRGYDRSFSVVSGLEPQINDRKVVFPGIDWFGDNPMVTMEFGADSSARVEISLRGRVVLSGTVVPCLTKPIIESGIQTGRVKPSL
jgi:hypothetical protein